MGGYTITLCDPRDDTDDLIRQRLEYTAILQREVLPNDPVPTVETVRASLDAMPARFQLWSYRARDEAGRLAGTASTGRDPEHEDNPDILNANVTVLPDHRRNGLGSRLLAELVRLAQDLDKTRILGFTNEVIEAADPFVRAYGFEPKQVQHLNHLPIAEVDRAMLERWVAEGPVRAADYELISWEDAVPDEHLDAWVDLVLVMNTAPRDDLEVNDFTLTAEEVRESEARGRAAGNEHWVLVARHKETGAFAGFHDVTWHRDHEKVVWVGGTGVKPEHRGHALGKWLKAAMTLRILDERPYVDDIRTGNADSNDAMLGINKEMGYRPMLGQVTWEASVDEVAKRLADRGLL